MEQFTNYPLSGSYTKTRFRKMVVVTYILFHNCIVALYNCVILWFILRVFLLSLVVLREIDIFSNVHHSIELFYQPTLMHNFLYSLTICLLHYYPRHVSSINMSIFRRKNCIHTASGIFALRKLLHSTLVESEDIRCCVNTTFPPEDGHVNARNMSRIIV